MKPKRAVFLFGAGAVLDWGAPRTICSRPGLTYIEDHGSDHIGNRVCCLTHLILAIGFKSKNGKTVTTNIYDLLLNDDPNNKLINFETIIDFIDELFRYCTLSNFKFKSMAAQMLAKSKSLNDELFDFKVENKTDSKYSLIIPGFEYPKNDFIPITISPEQKYCELLLNDLYQGIIGHVSKYSYHTSGHSVINQQANDLQNDLFINWCESLIDNGITLRMYTLNYDRIFKVLLQEKNIDVFEGFDLQTSSTEPGQNVSPNLKRIVTDFTSHVYYNLHGSAYWDLSEENSNQLPGYQFSLTCVPESNNPSAIFEISKNNPVLLSNIITGYQKVLKTAFSPFRQMLSAFDRDCIEADRLFVIGYSYADEHINDIIRNARKFNSDMKIILINPEFNEEHFLFEFLLHWGVPSGQVYQNIMDHFIASKDFNVKIIQMKFLDFLQSYNELNV